ncbi:hypothetical protein Tco_0143228, partial [Tanacetum coccineum]
MNPVATQQVALDNSLVAPENRLKIEKCNARITFSKPQREETYQVTLDALKLSPDFLNLLLKKNWLHLSRNLVILVSVICYLQSILIKCTSLGEHLLQSSIGASLGRLQDLIDPENYELKSCE